MRQTHRFRSPSKSRNAHRQRIVAAARAHFFSHGFRSVTMDDLAAELGISKKTLYAHFPGKMRVERFLADAELRRQVVHGHAAEAVTKKMGTRGGNDPLSVGVAAFARRPEATGLSHRDSFFTVENS